MTDELKTLKDLIYIEDRSYCGEEDSPDINLDELKQEAVNSKISYITLVNIKYFNNRTEMEKQDLINRELNNRHYNWF